MNDTTISTNEASRLIGVSRPWIYTLIDAGKLEAQKIGRDWRISRDSAERYAKLYQAINKKQADSHQ
jgi:excisionase family DNA binding protein